MKAYFAWKQIKVNCGHGLFVFFLATYQGKKIIENFNSVGAGAQKLGKSS